MCVEKILKSDKKMCQSPPRWATFSGLAQNVMARAAVARHFCNFAPPPLSKHPGAALCTALRFIYIPATNKAASFLLLIKLTVADPILQSQNHWDWIKKIMVCIEVNTMYELSLKIMNGKLTLGRPMNK